MDFFAGSGTVGKSCLACGREFILIDNNPASMEVMARRFAKNDDIQWIGFDPTLYRGEKLTNYQETENQVEEFMPEVAPDFRMLASTASYLQKDLEEISNLWKNSPFEWVLQLPARKKGKLGGKLVASWCASQGLFPERGGDSSEALIFNGVRYAIKFSTLWTSGIYKFQQIKSTGYDYLICLGVSPFEAHCWVLKEILLSSTENPNIEGRMALSIGYR